MVTRRGTRSFMEEELALENSQFQSRPETAATGGGPMHRSTVASSSSSKEADAANTTSTNVDQPTTPLASNPSSSSASVSSLSMSSGASTASTSDATVDEIVPVRHNKDCKRQAGANALPPDAPVNFGVVLPGLYRSSYPKPQNYAFLRQLGLKTIVTLVDKNLTDGYRAFMTANNIQHYVIAMKGTKKEDIPLSTMRSILRVVLNPQNAPLLIHCNHGKHRTGCVVAAVRKIGGWDNTNAMGEYLAFAGRKSRECDVAYINAFDLSSISDLLVDKTLGLAPGESSFCAGCGAEQRRHADRDADAVAAQTHPGVRVPNFIRATIFSVTMLFIWMISGSRMTSSNKR